MTAAQVQTHTSTLLFEGDRVYKRKKPLDLGFCDFRTREARLAACRAEVLLNQRLSPDVYLGVEDVLDSDGRLCDHRVVMRRMPDDRRVASLVTAGEDVTPVLRGVAEQLAALHHRSPAPGSLRELGGARAVRQLWTAGLDALSAFPDLVPEQLCARTRELALRWLAGRGPLLDSRVEAGRLVDGHGDLLADDIFALPDGPRILDCLEFDTRLRIGDGIADAAFLAMDLERLGAPELARTFLDAYEQAAQDRPPASLEDHYLGYRAHIRSKVACLRARQDPQPATVRLARDLADLALAHLERGRIRLVLVGGLPGTGKTTVADRLAQLSGWRHVSSDLTRKRLATGASGAFGEGRYSPVSTATTYGAVLELARTSLEHGQSVILDASWVDRAWREQARTLARDVTADLVELRCSAPAAVADARIGQRSGGPSDATPAIRQRLEVEAHPWPEAATIDTTVPLASTEQVLLDLVGLDERGLMPRGPG